MSDPVAKLRAALQEFQATAKGDRQLARLVPAVRGLEGELGRGGGEPGPNGGPSPGQRAADMARSNAVKVGTAGKKSFGQPSDKPPGDGTDQQPPKNFGDAKQIASRRMSSASDTSAPASQSPEDQRRRRRAGTAQKGA